MSTPVAARTSMAAANVPTAITTEESGNFLQAVIFGSVAALVGLAFYASFTIITHWYFGYVALAVGWMVGKAMMQGSGGVGGMRYQVTAGLLTYAAISLASIPIHLARAASQGVAIDWPSMWSTLLLDGIASPLLALQRGPFGIIGLVILFAGLRIAFRLTKEKQPKPAVSLAL